MQVPKERQFRVRKDMKWGAFRQQLADSMSSSLDQQRLWSYHKRENGTYRHGLSLFIFSDVTKGHVRLRC